MIRKLFTKHKHTLLAAAGLLIIVFSLVKYWIESTGVIRANTFGWIQAALLLIGLLLLASALVLYPNARKNDYRLLGYFFVTVFSFFIFLKLPALLNRAAEVDAMYGGMVATIGDDLEYQVLAVNMLYGEGYNPSFPLPLETYNLDLTSDWGRQLEQLYQANDPLLQYENDYFFRPPGLPFLLTTIYKFFGNQTLPARQTMAVLAWLTGLLLVWLGFHTAGWLGALTGGLAGLYHIQYYPGIYDYEFLLTEIPAGFMVTLFCLLLTIYLNKPRQGLLNAAGFLYAFLTLLRPNMVLAVPFLLIFLYFKKTGLKPLARFTAFLSVPLICWVIFASASLGKPVLITTQGDKILPEFNNIEVLEGIGPEHSGQGAWQIGAVYDEEGNFITNLYTIKPGESGLLRTLDFWFGNFEELPRLFYVKLRRGFFYDNSWSINIMHPEGLYLTGIAFLLLANGFRQPGKKPCILPRLNSNHILALQIGLVCLLMLTWNQVAFWLTCLIWFLIAIFSWLRPYGDVFQLSFQAPVWFLSFIICHAAITMLFAGYRYHWPLDVVLILYSLLGIFMTLFELLKRKPMLAIPYLAVIFTTLGLHYVFI